MSGLEGWPEGWYPDPCEALGPALVVRVDVDLLGSSHELLAVDPLAFRPALAADDLVHLTFAERILLPELTARGTLSDDQADRVRGVVRDLRAEAAGRSPVPVVAVEGHPAELVPPIADQERTTGTAPVSAPSAWVGAALPEAPVGFATEGAERPARMPGPIAQWWARTRESVASDLTVHGLAYLGVLLFFVGAFGLVAFAFRRRAT